MDGNARTGRRVEGGGDGGGKVFGEYCSDGLNTSGKHLLVLTFAINSNNTNTFFSTRSGGIPHTTHNDIGSLKLPCFARKLTTSCQVTA